MNSVQLRSPYEMPLYVFSVLVNLLIIALILVGALLLGYLNVLVGEPLSGPAVDTIRAALVALLLLVPGLVVYRQLTRAGTRGSAVRLSPRQFPDIHAIKDDFARRLNLQREPEIYLMSGNGTLNAFAASTFGYDFVVIHSELFSNTYEKNKDALAFIVGHELGHLRLGHTRLWYQLSTLLIGFPCSGDSPPPELLDHMRSPKIFGNLSDHVHAEIACVRCWSVPPIARRPCPQR